MGSVNGLEPHGYPRANVKCWCAKHGFRGPGRWKWGGTGSHTQEGSLGESLKQSMTEVTAKDNQEVICCILDYPHGHRRTNRIERDRERPGGCTGFQEAVNKNLNQGAGLTVAGKTDT